MTDVFVSCGFLPEEDVLALAPEIERLGYSGMTLPDHMFISANPEPYPYSADGKPPFELDAPWPNPFVLTAALSQVTTTLRFMTAVVILPLRHPIPFAKEVGTAARISGGRLSLGIGVGWQRDEFDALGIDFTKRGAIANEMIEALRTLWQVGPVEHHGRFFDFGPLLMEPVPPRIPIIVGGASDAAMRRAVQLADGYLLPSGPLDKVPAALERLRGELEAAGRADDEFPVFVPCFNAPADEIRPVLELGVGGITVMPWPFPGKVTTTVEEKIECLERYAEDVLAAARKVTA